MALPAVGVMQVTQVLGVNISEAHQIIVRVLVGHDEEHQLRLSVEEAHGLVDMITIALAQLPAPDRRPV